MLNHSIAQLHGGEFGHIPDSVERLVTMSLRIIDADAFTLKELILFRQREQKSGGYIIKRLRHSYLAAIDRFVERITTSSGSESDVREIERQFDEEMRSDLRFLKEELKRIATDVLLSKEVGVGVIPTAGMSLTPWTVPAGLIGIGALLKKAKNYREDRKDILGRHAMSWLFSIKQSSRILQAY